MMKYLRELTDVKRVFRPRKRWVDSIREILGYRGVSVEQGEGLVYGRIAWRSFGM